MAEKSFKYVILGGGVSAVSYSSIMSFFFPLILSLTFFYSVPLYEFDSFFN